MAKKELWRGNEALAETAIRAGCRYYFGYPITPQNEIPAYMSRRLTEVGGVFVQAESELASINMVFGAGATGARVMTSSSSPGISLMQEGISYIAGAETPAVIVNMMRGGPGLGNIAPSQADYFQAVKGGGHGDYNIIVLAPSSVQEIINLTYEAFDLAMKYKIPVMILGDGMLGQMSEPVILPEMKKINDNTDWAICNGNDQKIIRSLYLSPDDRLEKHNLHLQEKYTKIKNEYFKCEEYKLKDAEYMIVAYGTTARVCKLATDMLREKGIKIGLFRPITLWPFVENNFKNNLKNIKKVFVLEMAQAQLEEDIKLYSEGITQIKGFYKLGGALFDELEIIEFIMKSLKE
jgi:2-oxoglutarate ferredoxin oxidoreductase subunit alpha